MKYCAFALALLLTACSHGGELETDAGARRAHRKDGPCSAMRELAAAQGFEGNDFDHDGRVTRDEYLCNAGKRFKELDSEEADHILSTAELMGTKAARRLADRNRDHKISLLEFMQSADREFKAADKDRSGNLSRNEFHSQLP